MKGSLRNMEYIYIYLMLFCCLYIKECMCVINIDQDRCGFPGGSVSLSCTLPALEFTQPFAWSNDIFGGDISVCSTGGCGAPANSRYSATANTTGIYFTITGLTRADDEATWTCTMQGGGSLQPKSLDLTVGDYPTTCAISKNSDGSFKCETDCGYPTSDLTIDWFLNTTSTVVDLSNPSISIDTTSTPVCSSGGKASTTLPASNINKDGDLYCKCGMQTVCPEKALIVSGSEAVTASSSSSICDSCTTTNVLVALGIIFAVVCVALCWKVYFKFSDDDYIKILKTSYAITEGTTFTIPCSASSAASAATATSVSWERTIDGRTSPICIDGVHFSGATTESPSLTIIQASIADSGTYTCVASNSAGTARSSTQLTVSEQSGGGKGKFECSVTWCFRATIIATVVSVIGFILCIAGLIICVTCDDSVSSSNSVTVAIALAAVGFVLAAVTLVIVIILVILFCRGVITKKDDGQTIKHVSVKNNDPLTLTCPAGDLATTLTWTGPGGIPYVTGTTVEADLDGSVKRRISASHKKRGYALMFTEVWSSDMGIYTSTVDETVVKHEVIVQE